MNRIKDLRVSARMNQVELAALMRTTQPTIGRWETGKTVPNYATLLQLSQIFNCTVEDIMGPAPEAGREETLRSVIKGEDVLWGHVGLRFEGDEQSRWYPVTESEKRRIADDLRGDPRPWLQITTLQNKYLVIRRERLSRLAFLGDAMDVPVGDWNVSQWEVDGYPIDTYRGLLRWSDPGHRIEDDWEDDEDMRIEVERVAAQMAVSKQHAFVMLAESRVHQTDGQVLSLQPDRETIACLLRSVESDGSEGFVILKDKITGMEHFVQHKWINFIELVRSDVLDAID